MSVERPKSNHRAATGHSCGTVEAGRAWEAWIAGLRPGRIVGLRHNGHPTLATVAAIDDALIRVRTRLHGAVVDAAVGRWTGVSGDGLSRIEPASPLL